MKKFLDQHTIRKTTEVDLRKSSMITKARIGKRIKPLKKISVNITNPKQERARPSLSNLIFPLPRPILSNGVVLGWYRAKGSSIGFKVKSLHLIRNDRSLCGLPKEQPEKWIPWKTKNQNRLCKICIRLSKSRLV